MLRYPPLAVEAVELDTVLGLANGVLPDVAVFDDDVPTAEAEVAVRRRALSSVGMPGDDGRVGVTPLARVPLDRVVAAGRDAVHDLLKGIFGALPDDDESSLAGHL